MKSLLAMRQRLDTKLHKHKRRQLQYEPLDITIAGHFRLIKLAARSQSISDETIRCTLITSVWSSDETPYEALSYVWGDSFTTKTIFLNNALFHVTENLYIALQYLRLPNKSRTLWSDAICIDQRNITERNHQVAVIGEIYKNCSRVIAWLGETDDGTDVALLSISDAADIFNTDKGLSDYLTYDRLWDYNAGPDIIARIGRPY